MEKKQKGKCPFCECVVSPIVIDKNIILSPRRDKCQCPDCKEIIYTCRTPGCHNYAKGTTAYDHELCPSCTESAREALSFVANNVASVATTVAAAIIIAKKTGGK